MEIHLREAVMLIRRFLSISIVLLFSLAVVTTQIFAASTAAPAASSRLIKVNKFTGTIRIITPEKKVITVFRGSKLPDIPLGSKIQVLSGKAEIQAGPTVVTLNRRQAVMISKNDFTKGIEITAADDNMGPITARIEGSEVSIDKGEKINVIQNADGKSEIRAMQGQITLITPEGEKEIRQGTSVIAEPETGTTGGSGNVATIVLPEPPQIPVEEASPSIP
jgi:hypothetical protein